MFSTKTCFVCHQLSYIGSVW